MDKKRFVLNETQSQPVGTFLRPVPSVGSKVRVAAA